jgi:hypothetical protein
MDAAPPKEDKPPDLTTTAGWLTVVSEAKGEVVGYVVAGSLVGIALCLWLGAAGVQTHVPPLAPLIGAALALLFTRRLTRALDQQKTVVANALAAATLAAREAELKKDSAMWKDNYEKLQPEAAKYATELEKCRSEVIRLKSELAKKT